MPTLISAVVIILVVVIVRRWGRKNRRAGGYEYSRKEFFMSRPEHECFDALVSAVGDKYYVFPQVHLSNILYHRIKGQGWKGAFSHINQKSVDFVLCDKAYISPKLVIELDDQTHNRQDRIERDGEVERMISTAGLPLLRLENHGGFNPADLLVRIRGVLGEN